MNIKSYKKIVLAAISIFFVSGIILYGPHKTLQQLRQELLKNEDTLAILLNELSEKKETVQHLERIKFVNKIYDNELALHKFVKEIVCPQTQDFSDLDYWFEYKPIYHNNTLIQYPFKLVIRSSYNRLGDYLEYLELLSFPLVLNSVKVKPTERDFDIIETQLIGTICIPK